MTISGGQTLISVRGQAQRTVDADQATIHASVSQTRNSKEEASAEVARLLANIVDDLAALTGQPLTAQSARAALTWSTQSIRTSEEWEKSGMGPNLTGRHQASASLVIAARDFTLLPRVQTRLTAHDEVAVHSVQWYVDDDNPEWALVRADAIQAALLKGQDYASALGGAVIGVEHVADAGLLGGDENIRGGTAYRAAGGITNLALGAQADDMSLDPVPQVLNATIEARLTATIGALPRH